MTLSEAHKVGLGRVVALRSKRKMTREKMVLYRLGLENLRNKLMARHQRAEIVEGERIIALLAEAEKY